MTKRKVCVVITARPSYSRIKTALQAIKEHPALELQLVLAGPALLNKYGNIDNIMKDDGFEVSERVYTVLDGENLTSMAKTVGIGLVELSNVFYKLQPHMAVVIADRFETISVSIAAAYQNIPLVHIQGGEITGSIDEKVRHANTKFADIHLVCNSRAQQTVIKLGENPDYVFNTGCPSIDLAAGILKNPALNFDPYKKYGGSGGSPDYKNGYIVVMQHPVTTEFAEAKLQVEETLEAVKDLGIPAFWFSPNADAGSDAVSQSIRHYRNHYNLSHVHFFDNMIPADFLRLVYNASCLIGNSSMGIRECSFLGVPVINVGSRQHGRERGLNIIDTEYDKEQITDAVNYWLHTERPAKSFIYGSGEAGKNMAEVLATVPLRYSKILQFQDEEPVHHTGPVGVKRSTRKNIRPLNGRMLIQYTFDAAIESRLIDKIILSTDCIEIAETACSTPIQVPFMRPAKLSCDTTPTVEVIKHAIGFFDNEGEYYDNICLLQPTCPFRSRGFIDRCFETLFTTRADCLVSVKKVPHEYNPHWVFEKDSNGFLQIATGEKSIITSRQLLPEAYARDGSVYVFKADNIRKHNSIYGETISYLESDNLWHINIDTAEDWKRAEMIANMLSLVS